MRRLHECLLAISREKCCLESPCRHQLNTHLSRAAALDAAGDHNGAINELALGTQKKDLHCTRALGLRLLTGDYAPLLPAEGLRFLGEACDAGLPEAAARAAGILALGVRVAANWPLALAWLCRSAAGGWEPARQQLLAWETLQHPSLQL